MVKSKKMSKTSIAIIVLALLLVLSLVMGMTGAWFTHVVTTQDQTLTFGSITLTLEDEELAVTDKFDTAISRANIMPGDKIALDATLTNTGNDALVFARVWTTITPREGYSGSPLTNPIDLSETMEDASFEKVDSSFCNTEGWINSSMYNLLVGAELNDWDEVPEEWVARDLYYLVMDAGDYEALALDTQISLLLGNDYEGATITLHLGFYAVQIDNMLYSNPDDDGYLNNFHDDNLLDLRGNIIMSDVMNALYGTNYETGMTSLSY